MSIKEISQQERFTLKGGTTMKKTSFIVLLILVSLLVLATAAFAAPGDYAPAKTSDKLNLTNTYTDGVGNVYNLGYQFLDPRANNLTDPRTTVGGWKIFNANYTGENNVPYFKSNPSDPDTFNTYQRNVAGQLVHTDFQLNTNSCASCHMTHTAQSRRLLFRNGVYTTCTACHDGTLGFLNVFAAPTAENPFGGSKTAGTFGANMGRNASVHLANGAMKLSAAPGGNRANATVADDNGAGTWNADFTCGSCHGPHGSYSIRLLHSNPNNISLRSRQTGLTANTGGLWRSGLALETFTKEGYHKAFRIPTATWAANNPWYYGYPGGATQENTQNLPWTGRNPRYVTRIYHPSLYDPNTVGGPMAAIDATRTFNKYFGINFGSSFAYFKTAAEEDYFFNTYLPARFPGQQAVWADRTDFLAGMKIDVGGVVRVTASYNYTDNTANRYKSDFIKTDSYKGNVIMGTTNNIAYNVWCASCHTDYLLGSASSNPAEGAGVYSKAHRHTINRGATGGGTMQVKADGNNLLCVSCHFAHGVDSSFMSLADATLVDSNPAFAGTNDVNTSSALKRYVNMAVCWSCHANSSAATIKNSQWYWDSYNNDGRGNW